MNQLVLKTILAQVGARPTIVEDGAAAVEAWASGDWDLILLDVPLPVMDGPTAARAIRAREAETGRPPTPIIALTANATAEIEKSSRPEPSPLRSCPDRGRQSSPPARHH